MLIDFVAEAFSLFSEQIYVENVCSVLQICRTELNETEERNKGTGKHDKNKLSHVM